jgi:hypothetical protein
MEYIIATSVIVVAAGAVYILRSKTKRTTEPPAAFVCRNCGESHCQCEPQD